MDPHQHLVSPRQGGIGQFADGENFRPSGLGDYNGAHPESLIENSKFEIRNSNFLKRMGCRFRPFRYMANLSLSISPKTTAVGRQFPLIAASHAAP